jgi:hypothetical protein
MIGTGFQRALERWALALPLSAFLLLVGLAQSWPALALPESLARSPLLERLARNEGDALAILTSGPEALTLTALLGIWGIMALGATLATWLAYSFLAGGMLAGLAGAPFWPSCRRHFWSFAALGLLLGLLLLVLGGAALASSLLVGWQAALALALVVAQLLSLWGEAARACGVASGRYNPFALLGAGAMACLRRWPLALAVGALGLALQLGIGALYAGLAPLLIGSALASILLQQAALLAAQWVKLLRLSWALALVAPGANVRDTANEYNSSKPL